MPTPFAAGQTGVPAPQAIADLALPRRQRMHPSPGDWRDEVLYFLLVDRFRDAREATRPLGDRVSVLPVSSDGDSAFAVRFGTTLRNLSPCWITATPLRLRSVSIARRASSRVAAAGSESV